MNAKDLLANPRIPPLNLQIRDKTLNSPSLLNCRCRRRHRRKQLGILSFPFNSFFNVIEGRRARSFTVNSLSESDVPDLPVEICMTRTLDPALTLADGMEKIKEAIGKLKADPPQSRSSVLRFQRKPRYFLMNIRCLRTPDVAKVPIDSPLIRAYGFVGINFDPESSEIRLEDGSIHLFIPQIEVDEFANISILAATLVWDDFLCSSFEEAIHSLESSVNQLVYSLPNFYSRNPIFEAIDIISPIDEPQDDKWLSYFHGNFDVMQVQNIKMIYLNYDSLIQDWSGADILQMLAVYHRPCCSLEKCANINVLWASLIVEECVRLGVTYFCIAPGLRSSPLAIAASMHSLTTCISCFDERSLAYHAVGFARGSNRPAAVITSSGTAVSNLLPAVVEASNDFVPLLLLTADRPPELQDTGANQAINQVNHFGSFVRFFFGLPPPTDEIPARMGAPRKYSCEWTLDCLRGLDLWISKAEPFTQYVNIHHLHAFGGFHGKFVEIIEIIQNSCRGLLLIGAIHTEDEIWAALVLAKHLKWPVITDILSGLRLRKVLTSVSDIEKHIFFVDHFDHALLSDAVRSQAQPDVVIQVEWEIEFQIHAENSLTEPHVAHVIMEALRNDAALFIGNSMVIRDADMYGRGNTIDTINMSRVMSNWKVPCQFLRVAGNRGASGIDGLLSTAVGFATGCKKRVLCVVGDMSFLHDTNGLAILNQSILTKSSQQAADCAMNVLARFTYPNNVFNGIASCKINRMEYSLYRKKLHREGFVLSLFLDDGSVGFGEVQICALLDSEGTPKQTAHIIAQLSNEGFKTIKLKVARRSNPDEDAAVIQEIRKEVGYGINLRADANRIWTYEEAIQFGSHLKCCDLQYVEEPVRREDDIIRFCEETGLPAALDETIDNIEGDPLDKLQHFVHPRIVALVIKPSMVGGFENATKIAKWAHRHDKMAVISSAFESSLSLSAYVQFASYIESQNKVICRMKNKELQMTVAHGLGTYRWLREDLSTRPLKICVDPKGDTVEASVEDAERVVLVGYSMGARIALYMALRYTEKFYLTKALMVLKINGAVIISGSPGLKDELGRRNRIKQDDAKARYLLSHGLQSFLEAWYAADLWFSLRNHPHFQQIVDTRARHKDITNLARILSDSSVGRQPSLWEDLKHCETSLLLVSGEKDAKFKQIAHQMHRELISTSSGGDSQVDNLTAVIEVPDCGHVVHLENPLPLINAVRKFFNRLRERRSSNANNLQNPIQRVCEGVSIKYEVSEEMANYVRSRSMFLPKLIPPTV
ncbi:hypothetical protein QJS10_CPB17g00378 [Acorus calamus]|uniref:Mandelate racemase/muconate lactonizing enzyme C-terminal domain-containing protein n=1 Tax=Acorus calamus TaxID=4465 RepID=A0AAV9CXM1_ACOCL|nr:hypothetical protein QJS10_CPB17g00378 [Acorus calamus]